MQNYKILHILNDQTGGIRSVVNTLTEIFTQSVAINVSTLDLFKTLFSFRKLARDYDVVHFHGAWQLHILLLLFSPRPVVISPHGSFHTEGLKKSRFKKLIAKFLYVRFCYERADAICALTPQEVAHIKAFGIKNKSIATIPNAVDFNAKLPISAAKKAELLKLANGRRVVLSLCRLDPQKGLEMLIDAFGAVEHEAAVLFIAGSGEPKFTQKLKDKIKALDLTQSVFLLGYLQGAEKTAAFDVADIYALPSFNEGFGVTILEAYRQKIPTTTTTTTPFKEIDRVKFGWYIDPCEQELRAALRSALAMDKPALQKLGENGYEYMRAHYDISIFKRSYTALYGWILSGGSKPQIFGAKEN